MYYLVIVTVSGGRVERDFDGSFEAVWDGALEALRTIPESEFPNVSIGKRDAE